MDVREARSDDAEGIRRVARDSFATSYEAVLDDAAIDRIVDAEFGDDRLEDHLEDSETTLLVAADDEVVGFAQGALVEGDPTVGDVRWLHVAPDARGEDVGVRLLGEVVHHFEANDAALVRGHVLEGNESGGGFYEAQEFDRTSTEPVEIAGEEYEETVFEHHLAEGVGEEIVESADGPDGQELFVDYSAGDRGNQAPFYPVFADRSLSERYGWRCGNCESMDTTMDSSGRVKCGNCGNTRKATRWDGAYL